ncbi:hypothetical protein [Conexibacter sp. S30A1]|uniref:hypothetical protein n=1 Tax=Conexibacter sp. S30A1 TaxID=2937800 RepID=UPI00200D83E9|nr:hypothetical protein [Conexibacter sp. S30A1]
MSLREALLRVRGRGPWSGARGRAALLAAFLLALAPAPAGAAQPPVALNVTGATAGPPVPAGFVGLATEYWDVEKEVGTNPAKPDTAFEQTARNLAPYGGLSFRVGGDSTDWTWFPVPGMAQPPWVRWTMTPTWAAVTSRLIDDLHAHLIAGINMEADSAAVARAEVQEIRATIGASAPVTYELGNEPELYSHFPFYDNAAGVAVLGRPKGFSYAGIAAQWSRLARALPGVRLAGPGYSGPRALPYVGQFLDASGRLSLLTVHTYPLKSTRCEAGEHLQESALFDSQSLAGLAGALRGWTALAHAHGVSLRVDEMNAVTCGGQPGFTNTFGPALWALNILPLYAADGVGGVNFQTRPYTAQNLIQTDHTPAGWRVSVQPEYYGLLAFAQLTPPGSRILRLPALGQGLYAWAVRTPSGQTHVVLTNVGTSAQSFTLHVAGAHGAASVRALRAASGGLQASAGVSLAGQTVSAASGRLVGRALEQTVRPAGGAYDISVAPASAEIVTVNP